MRKLYGKPYSTAVYQLSKRYERQLRGNKLTIHRSEEIPLQQLEQVYGNADSDSERYIQANMLELDALFRALDRIHTNGDKQEHYTVTEWFYGIGSKGSTQALAPAV